MSFYRGLRAVVIRLWICILVIIEVRLKCTAYPWAFFVLFMQHVIGYWTNRQFFMHAYLEVVAFYLLVCVVFLRCTTCDSRSYDEANYLLSLAESERCCHITADIWYPATAVFALSFHIWQGYAACIQYWNASTMLCIFILQLLLLARTLLLIIRLRECGEYDEANQQLSLSEC